MQLIMFTAVSQLFNPLNRIALRSTHLQIRYCLKHSYSASRYTVMFGGGLVMLWGFFASSGIENLQCGKIGWVKVGESPPSAIC